VPSSKLRNILIHEYLDIDLAKVANAIPMAIEQYTHYVEQVAHWPLEHQKVSGGI
jgi:uncharacterized protein YutE (UPF0331/DUF86 family)